MKQKKIPILPWPGNSPDMKPIENLWMIVKRRIAQRKPTSKVMLIEALIDVWARDPEIKEMCPKLIMGMPKRIELLIKAKGASTKYSIGTNCEQPMTIWMIIAITLVIFCHFTC